MTVADDLSAVVEANRPRLGDSRCEFLASLFDYWRVLSRVVQPAENDALEPSELMRWEDGRRVVVFTALVMVEVDRSL